MLMAKDKIFMTPEKEKKSANQNRNFKRGNFWVIGVWTLVISFSSFAYAEEVPSNEFHGSLTAVPVQYTSVEGDQHQYEALNWDRRGYEGGLDDFQFEEKYNPEKIQASVDGHALIHNNDYEVNALVEKKDFGYVKLNYQEFTKYYNDRGGVYYPFLVLSESSLNRELALDISEFRVETGINIPDYPQLSFAYERHVKDGTKSRLSWAPVVVGSVTRNIAPSYQDINEVVDSIEFNESHTLKGFELKGQQAFEWSQAELLRHEQSLSNTSAASGKKIREQQQDPQYHLFTTTESAERWYQDERIFTGLAYHFMRMENNEVENIFELNEQGAPTNFSNPKQIRNARADNDYNSHAWAGSVMVQPKPWMNVITKLRTELVDRSGNSAYPSDTTPAAAGGSNPDNIINNIELSRTEDRVARIGEGISFRITKIPRTALYNEFEFEQLRNWLSEDRDSLAGQSAANAGEIFGRETVSYMSRGIWTLGAQVLPTFWLDWTSHLRLNRANTDYDDKRETVSTASGAKSAFMDAINITSQEFATRFTFKPKRWIKPSVRYQLQRRGYDTRVEDLSNVETTMNSHIFTFDLTLQPRHNLLITTGVSPQYAWIVTPARENNINNTPRYQANIFTWLLNLNYDFNEKLAFLGGFEYSNADNYVDYTNAGLPLGAAFNQMNVTAGLNWKLSQIVTLMLEYGFFRYNGDDRVDTSNYNANVVSLRTKLSWA